MTDSTKFGTQLRSPGTIQELHRSSPLPISQTFAKRFIYSTTAINN